MLALIVDEARSRLARTAADPESAVLEVFRGADGDPHPLRCAQLMAGGRARAESLVAAVLDAVHPDGGDTTAAGRIVAEVLTWPVTVTGAEAVVAILAAEGVSSVFAYAGTSELALCDAVGRTAGLTLINGRGDKESAFMAAGASLLRPTNGAAILHGARGLTNAAGAIADARRNEAGTVFVVGLPSTGSARFLPPHAETGLMSAIGTFTASHWQAPEVPARAGERVAAASQFVTKLREALAGAARPPHEPGLFGVPQDVAEARWVPLACLASRPSDAEPPLVDHSGLDAAVSTIRGARRPFILVDDYALRHGDMRGSLDRLARLTGAAVAQLRYRRGPMLFERIQHDEVEHFVGWLNQYSDLHASVLAQADLLITVEDRNMYRRVVGDLPACRKIAVNSDAGKVRKNEYLGPDDLLLEGDPGQTVAALADRLDDGRPARPAWFAADAKACGGVTPEAANDRVCYGRRAVTRELARTLRRWARPVLVDDSQMFGGMLSEYYDEFPRGLRVFGGHGGFVGGGLDYAVGLAIADEDVRVMCTLGDQGFTNSFQGLVAAVQQRARVLFVVCNNGGSVSLNKQAAASLGGYTRGYLRNVSAFRYRAVAEAIGVPATVLDVPLGAERDEIDRATVRLADALDTTAAHDGPALVELVLPGDAEAWRGIWLTQGFEEPAGRGAGPVAGRGLVREAVTVR